MRTKIHNALSAILLCGALLVVNRCSKDGTSYDYKDLTVFHLSFTSSDLLITSKQYEHGDAIFATASAAADEVAATVKTINVLIVADSGDREYLILHDDFPGLASEPEIRAYAGWIVSIGRRSHISYNRTLEVNPNGDTIIMSLVLRNGKVLADTASIIPR